MLEKRLFGVVDKNGASAAEFFRYYNDLKSGTHEAYQGILIYLGAQRLRTPQGLDWLARHTGIRDKNMALLAMHRLFQQYGTMWTEGVWEIVHERQGVHTTATGSGLLDPTVSGKVNNTSLFDSQIVKVSYELLSDSGWDVQTWLSGLFRARMQRGVSGAITNGATNFDSLLTAAVVKETTASPILLAYPEVLAAYSALDPAYLQSSSFVMNNSVRISLMLGTVDSFGRPLIQPAGQDNVQSIFGRPVLVNPDMTGLIAGSKSFIFGDLDASYTLRSVAGGSSMQRFNELYAGTREVGFRMYSRYSGYSTVQASSPSLVALQQHA